MKKLWKVLIVSFSVFTCQANTFLSFDNPRSISHKVKYAMQHHLRGVMVWQPAQDKTSTLMRAINSSLKPNKEFVVYFPNYVTSKIRDYHLENIEALLDKGIKITTLIYCFAQPHGDGTVSFDMPEVDTENIKKLKQLKKKFPKLKVLLSVGGWNYKGAFFEAVKNQHLKRLAYNCVALFKDIFDGIDIDWEFVSDNEFETFAKYYSTFINYLKQALQSSKQKKIITLALVPNVRFFTEFKNLKALSEKVNWINLMTYNYEGPGWSEITGHNAPLYSPDFPDKRRWKKTKPKFESVDSSVQGFLKAGVNPSKLVMGIAFYGRLFKGVQTGKQ